MHTLFARDDSLRIFSEAQMRRVLKSVEMEQSCRPANRRRGKSRRERKISSDAKVILFLGRLVSKKSPDMLLEALANWRANSGRGQDAVLVLAGPEEGDGFLAKLRSHGRATS
jgi:glycosyltransferase involved in cell wall biosynthesis